MVVFSQGLSDGVAATILALHCLILKFVLAMRFLRGFACYGLQ